MDASAAPQFNCSAVGVLLSEQTLLAFLYILITKLVIKKQLYSNTMLQWCGCVLDIL